MTNEERKVIELALEALELQSCVSSVGLLNATEKQINALEPLRNKAITALREALAQPEQEPVAWRETHSKVIKALAAIVTVHTPDKLFDLDAIPRDPVMYLVQQIKAAIDWYKPPQRKPLTDEMRKQMKESCDSDNMEMRGAFIDGWTSAEAAHGIKEQA